MWGLLACLKNYRVNVIEIWDVTRETIPVLTLKRLSHEFHLALTCG